MTNSNASSEKQVTREAERDTRQEASGAADPAESWPRKLNKALIAIGVIAFGLIVTDRIIEAFRADDAPTDIAGESISPAIDAQTALEPTDTDSLQSDAVIENSNATASATASAEVPVVNAETESVSNTTLLDDQADLHSVFGSRVVFVSASEPAFVLTENEQRFEVGSTVNETTTLAGISTVQLTLEHAGDPMVIKLPEPTVQ